MQSVWQFIYSNSFWMGWNLFLALVPLVLSFWLFRRSAWPAVGWWLMLVVMLVFLPNAPYVLTDLIHLIRDIQSHDSLIFNLLVILPTYFVFVLIGFEAYVLTLINLGQYLQRLGWSNWVMSVEVLLHGLSAIGIYLGRVERFNSWDLLTNGPEIVRRTIAGLQRPSTQTFMLVCFLVIAALYWGCKQITLALVLQRQYGQMVTQQQLSHRSDMV